MAAVKKQTVHFTIEGPWFTWFLRHLWVEGSYYKSIKTWNAAFPNLSTPNHLNTIFIELVSGKKKFTGNSDGPNGFNFVKDNTKFWSTTCGEEPNEEYPLLDSWEDVVLLRKAQMYLEEINLRDFRLNRDYGYTREENENNSLRWKFAAMENEEENPIRKRVSSLYTELRNIHASLGLDIIIPELQEHTDLDTLRIKARTHKGVETQGAAASETELIMYERIRAVVDPVMKRFNEKYGKDILHFPDEDIKIMCGIDEPNLQRKEADCVIENNKKRFEESGSMLYGMMPLISNSIIPGLNLDPTAFINNMMKDESRTSIEPEEVDYTKWQSGYIDPSGLFYGCADIQHREFSRRLCIQFKFFDKLSKKPKWLTTARGEKEPDPEIELDNRGWVRVSVNRFYWDTGKQITNNQKLTIKNWMNSKKMEKTIFNGVNPVTLEEGVS